MIQSGKNITEVFDKLNDLKSIFKFGERVVPVIQSLIEFMKDILPLLDTINDSIAESTNRMPQATNQINNVTSATELATTEILDLVDAITDDLGKFTIDLDSLIENYTQKQLLLDKIREEVKGNDVVIGYLDELKQLNGFSEKFEEMKERLNTINESTYKITLSLQVQDITSQQLSAVNHLIDSVHGKLMSLVNDIDKSELKDEIGGLSMDAPEGATFDPNAKYDKSPERQESADAIIEAQKETASQEEIDKLFS